MTQVARSIGPTAGLFYFAKKELGLSFSPLVVPTDPGGGPISVDNATFRDWLFLQVQLFVFVRATSCTIDKTMYVVLRRVGST